MNTAQSIEQRSSFRRPRVRVFFGLLIFAALAILAAIYVDSARTRLPVYPERLSNAPSYELGELISLLLPNEDAGPLGWNVAEDTGIDWLTDGYEAAKWSSKAVYLRRGIARVNVLGVRSTVLRRATSELAWTVTLVGEEMPKFGPQRILVSPGLPDESCFGSLNTGCDFPAPTRSLQQSGFVVSPICSVSSGADSYFAFDLEKPGKRRATLVWEQSGGSGGVGAEISLLLKPADPSLCESETAARTASIAAIINEAHRAPAATEASLEKSSTNVSSATTASSASSVKASNQPVDARLVERSPSPLGSVSFDQALADQAEIFDSLNTRTEICLAGSARSWLRQGVRDRDQLVKLGAMSCGGPMISWMVSNPKTSIPEAQAKAFIVAMAYEQLTSILREGR